MLLKEYLENPCGKLSIPYWKSRKIKMPANMEIVHYNYFDSRYLKTYNDETYFRLIHRLENVKTGRAKDFSVKTAELSDLPCIARIINESYTDLSVDDEQLFSYTKTEAYDGNLWILAYENRTDLAVGCAIADFDAEVKEGILEWVQVLPEYRGRGVGKMLVNELLFRMERADFATVSGKTDNPTDPEKLYRACGFKGNDIWHILTKK